jgi:hypothetical protein
MKNEALLLSIGIAGLAACGGQDAPEPAKPPSQTETTDVSTPPASGARRDINSLDICDWIPAADVADVLGGVPKGEPVGTTITGLGTQCLYTVLIDGESLDARISMSPPDFWDAEIGESARTLAGLGDSAYATLTDAGVNGEVHDIYVLKRNEAEINVSSNTLERARALAEFVLSKL